MIEGLLVIASLLAVKRYRFLFYAWLAFAVPFGFYLIVVFDPRTHVYTFYAGASLLAGATLSALWDRVHSPVWRSALSIWYTRQAPRTHCPMPDVYIDAENVQDPIYIDRNEIERDYALAGIVEVDGQARVRWYARDAGEPLIVDEADYRQWWQPNDWLQVTPRGEEPGGGGA